MQVSSQSWPKRMMTRRSSSARMAWSTAHPECRCGSRYDIFFPPTPRRLLLLRGFSSSLLPLRVLLRCFSARRTGGGAPEGRNLLVDLVAPGQGPNTDTPRAPPRLQRGPGASGPIHAVGPVGWISRGTLELGPWSCSRSQYHGTFLFFIYLHFICKKKIL